MNKNLKGGYKIIPLDKDLEDLEGTLKINGIYEKIESSYRKPLLLSGISIGGVEKNDVFINKLEVIDGDFVISDIYGYKITIDDEDNVTTELQNDSPFQKYEVDVEYDNESLGTPDVVSLLDDELKTAILEGKLISATWTKKGTVTADGSFGSLTSRVIISYSTTIGTSAITKITPDFTTGGSTPKVTGTLTFTFIIYNL